MNKLSRKFVCVTLVALQTAFVLSACSPGGNTSPDGSNNQGNTNNGSSVGAPTNSAGDSTTGDSTPGDSTTGDSATGSSTNVDSIPTDWEISAHARTYVVDNKGENSACTLCHSPTNFIPTIDEVPDSCFICKFELSEPPPLTAQDIWEGIPCRICHEPDRKGNIPAEFSWLEVPILEQYAEAATSTDLCVKCHKQVDLPGHKPQSELTNAHADILCTDCHNAHNLEASCSTGGCHDDILDSGSSIAGHDDDHQNVSCIACHQAGGLASGMSDDSGIWIPLISITSVSGAAELVPYSSHNIVKESACDSCHFSGNPWSLNIH